jgi:hypothetical protein
MPTTHLRLGVHPVAVHGEDCLREIRRIIRDVASGGFYGIKRDKDPTPLVDVSHEVTYLCMYAVRLPIPIGSID